MSEIRPALLRFIDLTNRLATGELAVIDGTATPTLIDRLKRCIEDADPSAQSSALVAEAKKLVVMLDNAASFTPAEFAWETERLRDILDGIHPRANLMPLETVLSRVVVLAAAQREPDATAN